MIKLKQLINEIQHKRLWKTPEGTPDDVVNALHLIIAEVIRRKKKVNDYVSIQRIYKNKAIGRVWTIHNKTHPEVSLVFRESTKEWTAPHIGPAPLSQNILRAIIERWVK